MAGFAPSNNAIGYGSHRALRTSAGLTFFDSCQPQQPGQAQQSLLFAKLLTFFQTLQTLKNLFDTSNPADRRQHQLLVCFRRQKAASKATTNAACCVQACRLPSFKPSKLQTLEKLLRRPTGREHDCDSNCLFWAFHFWRLDLSIF